MVYRRKSLSKLDRRTSKFTNYLVNDTGATQLHDILEDKNGKLWISTQTGLLYFDPEIGRFEYYKQKANRPGALQNDNVTQKLIDNSNNLWFGLFHGGVSKLSKTKSAFELVTKNNDRFSNYPGAGARVVSSTASRAVIQNREGLYNWDLATGRFSEFYNAPAGQNIWHAYADGNTFYLATSNGLVIYNAVTGAKTTYRNNPADALSIGSDVVSIVYKDHTGTVWTGSEDGGGQGICSYDPVTKKFTRYPYHSVNNNPFKNNDGALDDQRVISIYEDMQNTLWVGTNEGGLNKFDRKTGKFFSYLNNQNKKMSCVSSIFEDRAGRFWIGTYQQGLFQFDRKKGVYIRQVNEQTGLLHNGISSINEDSVGHIWITTERGLNRLDPKTMALRNFKIDDIIPGTSLASTGTQNLVDGRFVLATDNGLALFNPKHLDDDEYPPMVHIERIRYNAPGANDSTG
jgi:ligand-binding sensor domain-containing protein